MAVTERSRNRLHNYLEKTMGDEHATTLMEMLPGVGWADVATKRDLDDLRHATTRDIDDLRQATTRDMEDLRQATTREIAHLREVIELRFDKTDARVDAGLAELRAHMDETLRRQLFAMCGFTFGLAGLGMALVRLA